jgi:hypothetical protein
MVGALSGLGVLILMWIISKHNEGVSEAKDRFHREELDREKRKSFVQGVMDVLRLSHHDGAIVRAQEHFYPTPITDLLTKEEIDLDFGHDLSTEA